MSTSPKQSPKQFLLHASVYALGAFALQAASMVLVPLYTHCLTPAEYGLLEIINRVGDLVIVGSVVNGLRMAALTFHRQAATPEQESTTAATVFALQAGFALVTIMATFGAQSWLGNALGLDDPALLTFGILVCMCESMTVVPFVLMQARQQSVRFVTFSLLIFTFRVGLAIVCLAWLGWGIQGLLIARLAVAGLFGIWLIGYEGMMGSFKPDVSRLGAILRFALPFVPGGICAFVLNSGDRFILARYAGAAEVGIYALAGKLASAVGTFAVTPLYQVWAARMYDAYRRPDAARYVGEVITRILAAFAFVGLGLCLLKREVLAVLSDEAFLAASDMLDPLVAAYFLWSAAELVDAAFFVHRCTGRKPWIMFASMLVISALYAVLIPWAGAMGAAWATLAGFAFHLAITIWLAQKVTIVRYEWQRAGILLVSAASLVIVSNSLPATLVSTVARIAMLLSWPVLLWITGVISKDEKKWAAAAVSAWWPRVAGAESRVER